LIDHRDPDLILWDVDLAGSTQDLATLDIGLAAITQAGRWKSRMPLLNWHCSFDRGVPTMVAFR
jgi:hypothetical protein